MSKKKLAVLTPFYKKTLEFKEVSRMEISLPFLEEFDHFFLVPKGLQADLIKYFPTAKMRTCESRHLKSTFTYNKYLLTEEFYSQFENYSHIMILQFDALILRPIHELNFEIYDYIGSPWKKAKRITIFRNRLFEDSRRYAWYPWTKIQVGNGGLSIRRVESMIAIVRYIQEQHPFLMNGDYNEDIVVSFLCKKLGYKFPSKRDAQKMFCEEFAKEFESAGQIYGFHALDRFNPKLENKLLGVS